MADLTADRKTDRFNPEDTVLPNLLEVPCAASTTFYAGLAAGVNASGLAVQTFASTTRFLGRVEADVTCVAASSKNVRIRPGCFYFDNDGSVTQAYVEHPLYFYDNHTVGIVAAAHAYAGVCKGIRADGQIAVQVGIADPYATVDYTMPRYCARGSCITNHSLSAFTVGTNTDGITYVEGDVVLLVGQTSAAANGPYVVGAVATTAPLTRPAWWPAAGYVPVGAIIELGGEGTLRGGMSYKSFVITATVVIDTTTPLLYPQFLRGSATISTGTASVASQSITTQAYAVWVDTTTADKSPTCTVTAGADQAGNLAFAAGTGTDVINYLVCNW
jgi:hypothetical protein